MATQVLPTLGNKTASNLAKQGDSSTETGQHLNSALSALPKNPGPELALCHLPQAQASPPAGGGQAAGACGVPHLPHTATE